MMRLFSARMTIWPYFGSRSSWRMRAKHPMTHMNACNATLHLLPPTGKQAALDRAFTFLYIMFFIS